MQQQTQTSFEIDANGTIFQVDKTLILGDDGATVIATGNPHRVPYAPGSALPSDANAQLVALANLTWTPAVVASFQAQSA